jgi:hypothetical protein
MLRSYLALAAAMGLAASGCAHAPETRAAAPTRPTTAGQTVRPDATGIWDWSFRSRDDQGDERLEQEEWHLSQKNGVVEGYYDRIVDMKSLDDRLFRCNQKVSFTKYTRVRLAGRIEGMRVVLREVAFEAKPGPCDDGARNLVEYWGVLTGPHLSLRWGSEAGQQTLIRRIDQGRTPLVEFVNFADRPTEHARTPGGMSVPVGGTWEWELRSIDAEGDERLEREEWHLAETPDGVKGYYDRTVKRVRGEGRFACGESRFETATRYTIVGQRVGERLMLTEVDYKSEPSKCDNALRRLDTYRGSLNDGESLVLSWGSGSQLLRRKR